MASFSRHLIRKTPQASFKKRGPMFHRKMLYQQLEIQGLRLGDSCSIMPSQGKRRAFTLNRHRMDFVSGQYRPQGLCMTYMELPIAHAGRFHYRLELESPKGREGRFVLKTLEGEAFC